MLQTFRGGTVPSHSMHLFDSLCLALLGSLGPPAKCAWAEAQLREDFDGFLSKGSALCFFLFMGTSTKIQ